MYTRFLLYNSIEIQHMSCYNNNLPLIFLHYLTRNQALNLNNVQSRANNNNFINFNAKFLMSYCDFISSHPNQLIIFILVQKECYL